MRLLVAFNFVFPAGPPNRPLRFIAALNVSFLTSRANLPIGYIAISRPALVLKRVLSVRTDESVFRLCIYSFILSAIISDFQVHLYCFKCTLAFLCLCLLCLSVSLSFSVFPSLAFLSLPRTCTRTLEKVSNARSNNLALS